MNKNLGKSASQAAIIAAGVAAVWYLVHQVWRAIYVASDIHNYRVDAYLGIDG